MIYVRRERTRRRNRRNVDRRTECGKKSRVHWALGRTSRIKDGKRRVASTRARQDRVNRRRKYEKSSREKIITKVRSTIHETARRGLA